MSLASINQSLVPHLLLLGVSVRDLILAEDAFFPDFVRLVTINVPILIFVTLSLHSAVGDL